MLVTILGLSGLVFAATTVAGDSCQSSCSSALASNPAAGAALCQKYQEHQSANPSKPSGNDSDQCTCTESCVPSTLAYPEFAASCFHSTNFGPTLQSACECLYTNLGGSIGSSPGSGASGSVSSPSQGGLSGTGRGSGSSPSQGGSSGNGSGSHSVSESSGNAPRTITVTITVGPSGIPIATNTGSESSPASNSPVIGTSANGSPESNVPASAFTLPGKTGPKPGSPNHYTTSGPGSGPFPSGSGAPVSSSGAPMSGGPSESGVPISGTAKPISPSGSVRPSYPISVSSVRPSGTDEPIYPSGTGKGYPSGSGSGVSHSGTGKPIYPSGTGKTYPSGSGTRVSPSGTGKPSASEAPYPSGSGFSSVLYPSGRAISSTPYPSGSGVSSAPYPSGNGVSSAPYPRDSGISSTPYPSGSGVSSAPYPSGTGVSSASFPSGTGVSSASYPSGTASSAAPSDTSSSVSSGKGRIINSPLKHQHKNSGEEDKFRIRSGRFDTRRAKN